MAGVPTFLSGKQIVLTKTLNGGFAVSAEKTDPVTQCVSFDSAADLKYYLDGTYFQPETPTP